MCDLAPLNIIVTDVNLVESVTVHSQGGSVSVVLVTESDVWIGVDIRIVNKRNQPVTRHIS